MKKNLDKWDKKIKLSLPAGYVFDRCMEIVKEYVDAPKKMEQWEELLEFLIDKDFFWECNVSFEEVIKGFVKNDEIRFVSVNELSQKGLEYYAKINKEDDVYLIGIEKERIGGYDIDDDNYIATLKNNTIAIWNY